MSSTLTQIFIDINILFITYASAIFIKTVKYLYSVEIKNNELTKKNLENKMAILTSQLHPHFLFNTFNNLYTLSKEKSEQVPNIILKLSEVIRYILYDYEKLYVKLTKELEIVKSYIDIEKLRYDNQLKIEFLIDLPENKKSDIFIPPLLLFTFVENAFKHGVSQSLNDCYIIIHIKTINDILHIKVENSTDELITQERDEKREKIGLQNIIDRLNLYYPNKHKLRINGEKNSYNINLELKMDTYEK